MTRSSGRTSLPRRAGGATFRARAAFSALLALGGAACASLPFGGSRRTELWGITAPWDPRSAASARAHGSDLDVLVSGWIALDTLTGMPAALARDPGAPGAAAARRFALVTTYSGDRVHPEIVRRLGSGGLPLARAAGTLARVAHDGGFGGLVLDLESLAPRDVGALSRVVRAVADSSHARGLTRVAVAVPASDTASYPASALAGADLILVTLYDEHWAASSPGALSSPDWVRRRLQARAAEVGAGRLVAALPLFGYRWRAGAGDSTRALADVVSFEDARRFAAANGRVLEREPATHTLRVVAPDGSEVWVTDAELLEELLRVATEAGVAAVALWRLGLEDPAVWRRLVR